LSWHAEDPVDRGDFSSYPNRVFEARRRRRALQGLDPALCARTPECAELTPIELPEARRVSQVLPNGARHEDFLRTLDVLAGLLGRMKDGGGRPIPLIFRPWHEHNGSWFWWGGEFRRPEEFGALWRLTVERLRDHHGLHHLIWAYSPNQSRETVAEYFSGYPGDAFVDVFGFDAYHGLDSEEGAERTGRELAWIVEQAEEHGKLPALTETGLEAFRWGPYADPSRRGERNPTWFSRNVGRALSTGPAASRIRYWMVWRNASETHHYFPSVSDAEVISDFLAARREHRWLLLDDLKQSLYSAF
jgi:mannan endo-1,4-beta-mannosidase